MDPAEQTRVDNRAVHGSLAKNLIAISKDARMLVVGTRGLGGFAGMVLGSVSDQAPGRSGWQGNSGPA